MSYDYFDQNGGRPYWFDELFRYDMFGEDLSLLDPTSLNLKELDPLDPTRALHLSELGRIAKKKGNLVEAEKLLQEAYALHLYHLYIQKDFGVSSSESEYIETLMYMGKSKEAKKILNSSANYGKVFLNVCQGLWIEDYKNLTEFINEFCPKKFWMILD